MGKCGSLGCRNKLIFYQQIGTGVLPPNYQNMKNETFDNQTGNSITLTKVTPVNFTVGIFRNGVRLEETTDYTLVGQIVTFVVPLVNDNIVAIYF